MYVQYIVCIVEYNQNIKISVKPAFSKTHCWLKISDWDSVFMIIHDHNILDKLYANI